MAIVIDEYGGTRGVITISIFVLPATSDAISFATREEIYAPTGPPS
jgi:hypothetical protein